jgi:hypothetical protein
VKPIPTRHAPFFAKQLKLIHSTQNPQSSASAHASYIEGIFTKKTTHTAIVLNLQTV